MSDKIQPTHLNRRATIYLRQSTLRQLHEHPESTKRQYALRQRAMDLGWAADHIDVIDEDLGQSGTGTAWRPGFRRLAEGVAHGRVGAIFVLEVSRLARCSADWYRMLDLCGFADVVLVDEQSVYAPRDSNDRLLLGLKGTMSEAEQVWMRLRLQGGRVSKAHRGELHFLPPTGYEWDKDTHHFRLDSDEHIQRAIRLIFEQFRIGGSAYGVLRFFANHGLKLPIRDSKTGEVTWEPPCYSFVLSVLHNPIYAGAYVYGRRDARMGLVNGEVRRRRTIRRAQEAWTACLHAHHPAYISWEEFVANQRKLRDNRSCTSSPDQRGAAREGSALLQGLALCGRCGLRMAATYQTRSRHAYYVCRASSKFVGELPACWSVAARAIDDAVAKLFLQTVQPPEIELSLAVASEAARQVDEVDRQWKLRLDRARYEARLAERRYKAVDPENRVVARTLERQWNEKLRELETLEHEYDDARRCDKLELTDKDRKRILSLANDLSQVWNAATTTHAERKNLLRMLVTQVSLSPIDLPHPRTRIRLLWKTGAVSELTVPRPGHFTTIATPREALDQIRKLASKRVFNTRIAEELNRRGLRTGQNHPWTEMSVRRVRYRYDIAGDPSAPPGSVRQPDQRFDGLYSVHGIAARFHVSEDVVRYWIKKGWLRSTDGGGLGRALWFKLDRATVQRLTTRVRNHGPKP